MPTKEQLHELFQYIDGQFIWKKDNRARKVNGLVAGFNNNLNYRIVCINNKAYKLHRLIWIYHYGSLSDDVHIDHINGNPSDNRIENLRICNSKQNQYNSKIRKDNKSGIKGVSWNKNLQKWHAQLVVNGKKKHFGFHDDLEFAELVISEARNKFHGKFANNG